jgi:hypothetical protein
MKIYLSMNRKVLSEPRVCHGDRLMPDNIAGDLTANNQKHKSTRRQGYECGVTWATDNNLNACSQCGPYTYQDTHHKMPPSVRLLAPAAGAAHLVLLKYVLDRNGTQERKKEAWLIGNVEAT